jgi:hypothetical protein
MMMMVMVMVIDVDEYIDVNQGRTQGGAAGFQPPPPAKPPKTEI